MTAWHAERMAREKRMKPLGDYLKTDRELDPDQGASKLRAMIGRMREKQEGKHGAR